MSQGAETRDRRFGPAARPHRPRRATAPPAPRVPVAPWPLLTTGGSDLLGYDCWRSVSAVAPVAIRQGDDPRAPYHNACGGSTPFCVRRARVLDGVRRAACQTVHAAEPPENARILLANSKVPKWVCPTCLLGRQKRLGT